MKTGMWLVAGVLFFCAAGTASAGLLFNFDTLEPVLVEPVQFPLPATPPPWLTAQFDNTGTPGVVQLTLSASGLPATVVETSNGNTYTSAVGFWAFNVLALSNGTANLPTITNPLGPGTIVNASKLHIVRLAGVAGGTAPAASGINFDLGVDQAGVFGFNIGWGNTLATAFTAGKTAVFDISITAPVAGARRWTRVSSTPLVPRTAARRVL